MRNFGIEFQHSRIWVMSRFGRGTVRGRRSHNDDALARPHEEPALFDPPPVVDGASEGDAGGERMGGSFRLPEIVAGASAMLSLPPCAASSRSDGPRDPESSKGESMPSSALGKCPTDCWPLGGGDL